MKDDPRHTHDMQRMSKLLDHNEPAATPSPDALKRRARELAEIDGRGPDELRGEDMDRALAELQGLGSRNEGQLNVSDGDAARDTSEPAAGSASRTPRYVDREENEAAREIAEQGVEEAEHEQMHNARRLGGNQEGR